MNRLKQLWTGDGVPTWKVVVFGIVIFGMIFIGLPWIAAKAHGEDTKVEAMMSTPKDVPAFVSHFKAGDYWHAHSLLPYSRSFHRFFMHVMRMRSDNHPKWVPCPGTGNLGCTWTRYKRHDRCAVSSLPDTFDADSCRDSKHLRGLLSSPYWKRRGDLYNKWTARIVFCGSVMAVTVGLKGAPPLAIVGGAACVGGKVVP